VRIYKTYGENAIERVRADPYTLARDIHGIGFATADRIAQKLGIPHDSILRACAGLDHVLLEATGDGHCALPLELLKEEAGKLLGVEEKIVITALERTLASQQLVLESIGGQELAFLPALKRAEENIAQRIRQLCASPAGYPQIELEKAVTWCQQKTGKELAPSQREALKQALTRRVLIITGGPGVGKTTLVNAILLILRAKKVGPPSGFRRRPASKPGRSTACWRSNTLRVGSHATRAGPWIAISWWWMRPRWWMCR
jgi:exodeoxyribonuclease V alpha subunit